MYQSDDIAIIFTAGFFFPLFLGAASFVYDIITFKTTEKAYANAKGVTYTFWVVIAFGILIASF